MTSQDDVIKLLPVGLNRHIVYTRLHDSGAGYKIHAYLLTSAAKTGQYNNANKCIGDDTKTAARQSPNCI